MATRAAKALHLALFFTGVVLYVVFIIPRWWVLTGDIPSTLGTAGRIAAGIPIAAAAWPVWQILQTALRSKARTPEIALRLRAWSAVLHVVAGVLILLASIAEIWLSLETGGPWLFGVYGAAGAIAILAFLALYLSFVAEKPPAGPKPAKAVKAEKPKAEKKPRGKKREAATEAPAQADTESGTDPETRDVVETEAVVIDSGAAEDASETAAVIVTDDTVVVAEDAAVATPSSAGSLRNKRPAGKRRRLGR
jgi:hypothetical protein